MESAYCCLIISDWILNYFSFILLFGLLSLSLSLFLVFNSSHAYAYMHQAGSKYDPFKLINFIRRVNRWIYNITHYIENGIRTPENFIENHKEKSLLLYQSPPFEKRKKKICEEVKLY